MVFLLAGLLNGKAAPPVGVWSLNGNLNNDLGGGLALVATGWTPSYETVSLGAENTTVLCIPALSPSQAFTLNNPISPGAGESRVNDYSIGWDVNFRLLQTFESLLQTSANNSDDVDVFLGLGTLAPSGSAPFSANTWYRLTMTSQVTGPNVRRSDFYLNGAFLASHTGSTDDRYSLAPTTDHIFTDDNGETGDAYLSSFALWSGALTGAEISAMGGPDATGFAAVPEPASVGFTAVGLAVLGLAMRFCRTVR